MRKFSAISFFIIYLFSATEAHQLLKLPIVFQHFSEHQQEDRQITFLQFLEMHYMHGSPKDKDYDRDMQLPFKTSSDCVISVTPVTVPEFGASILSPQEFILKNDFFTVNDSFVAAAFRGNVFQPPRI